MSLVIPIDFANTRFIFRCAGVVDPMGFSIGTTCVPPETPLQVATALADAFDSIVWGSGANASEQYTFEGCSTTTETLTGPIIADYVLNTVGTVTAAVPPPNLSLLVSKNTASGGRKNRGRLYMPTAVVFETEVNHAGVLSAITTSAYQAVWDAFWTQLDGDGFPPWLLHSDPADTPTPITAFTVQSLMATQRRRMR